MAGVAFGDIHLRFTWQVWHLETSTFVLRGRRGTYGTGLALVARFGWDWSPGVALGDIHCRFTWQAWRLVTSTCVSRGRRSTYGTGLALVVRVRLGWDWSPVTPQHFAWQAWHRRGTWQHPPPFHLAGVALGDIYLRFAWQAWLWWRHFAWQAWHLVTSIVVSGGRHPPSLQHVAGVHLATPTCVLGGRGGTGRFASQTWQGYHCAALSHTIFRTHHLLPQLWHTHTIFDTPLCHTPSFTHTIFRTQLCHPPSLTHHLSHTTLSHTIFHTPSFSHRHRPSFTHHFVTHHLSHTTLSHTIFDTHLCHTSLSHALFHTQFSHTPSFTHNFVTHTSSFFVTHHLSHTTLSHATLFYFSILHHLLCLSFLPNIWCSLLEEVALWVFPVR